MTILLHDHLAVCNGYLPTSNFLRVATTTLCGWNTPCQFMKIFVYKGGLLKGGPSTITLLSVATTASGGWNRLPQYEHTRQLTVERVYHLQGLKQSPWYILIYEATTALCGAGIDHLNMNILLHDSWQLRGSTTCRSYTAITFGRNSFGQLGNRHTFTWPLTVVEVVCHLYDLLWSPLCVY